MPFKSQAQRKACYARKDPNWDCEKWERHTKGELPKKKKKGIRKRRNSPR